MQSSSAQSAPLPAFGSYRAGFEPAAQAFAQHLRDGLEMGTSFAVYHRGELVVDLWGGLADARLATPWQRDQLIVVFSVTKGLAAMAFHLLAERGALDWDAPVASVWPEFAQGGKAEITFRCLFGHRAGLCALDQPLTLADCVSPERREFVAAAIAAQRPSWEPGTAQGYHAQSFGLYAREIFERIAGESVDAFLRRELFAPLGADVHIVTPASEDARIATLYPVGNAERLVRMALEGLRGVSAEGRVARNTLQRSSLSRRAFVNPSLGPGGLGVFNEVPVRRGGFLSASATASAHGLARAYLPFALGGEVAGRRYFSAESIALLMARQSFSHSDAVLHKPLGWSQGFLKEEGEVFSPHPESFGHAGMGGSLGWVDPKAQLTIGYVTNRMDWRVRSKRALGLCRALYACPGLDRPGFERQ